MAGIITGCLLPSAPARSVTWFKGSWLVLSLLERFSCVLNKNTSLFKRVTKPRHVVTVVTIVTCEVEEISQVLARTAFPATLLRGD